MTNKPVKKTARQKSRNFALQALYQWLVNPSELADADEFTRGLVGFNRIDLEHYERILHGTAKEKTALMPVIEQALDRSLVEVSPIELAIILLGCFELNHCPEIPYKVILNEYIEVAKDFGGTDGFRYVNGILHQIAQQVRPIECRDANRL